MLNRVIIMGRFVKDPQLRYTRNNTPVASFSLAVERDYKSSDGQKITDFFDCIAWRGSAEFISRNFAKGRMAVVEGKMQPRAWEDEVGNRHRAIDIVVENIYFADSKRAEQAGEHPEPYTSPNVQDNYAAYRDEDDENGIPF